MTALLLPSHRRSPTLSWSFIHFADLPVNDQLVEVITELDVMTVDCHVARHFLPKPSACHPNSIWITDAILTESIQRFTCVHRRYGSSVPGPLEARRRSRGRKNTSLASTSHGGPPVDAGALFEPNCQSAWWKAPNSSEPHAVTAERMVSGSIILL